MREGTTRLSWFPVTLEEYSDTSLIGLSYETRGMPVKSFFIQYVSGRDGLGTVATEKVVLFGVPHLTTVRACLHVRLPLIAEKTTDAQTRGRKSE